MEEEIFKPVDIPKGYTKSLENQFQNHFIEHHQKMMRHCELVDWEVPLVNPHSVLTKDFQLHRVGSRQWGRIDIVIRWRSDIYVVELKYPAPGSPTPNFWDATKVCAYTVYYNWQMDAKAKPAIMMPIDCFKLEHQIVANKMKIQLFGIKGKGSGMTVVPVVY